MEAQAPSYPLTHTLARPRLVRLAAGVQLSAIVAIAFVARALVSIGTQSPGYFPDEYIYSALGRSLGTGGHLAIRGAPVHFPALLEPLVAAPLWRLASATRAYELIQVENSLFVALAAVPAYLLARELRLSQRYALVCAAFAVAVPDGLLARYVLTDPLAYPLVLASLYAGLVCLARPSRRSQACFLVLAGLATAARVQYAALFLAFAVAALVFERCRALRVFPILSAALALCGAGSLLLGPGRVLGYYSGVLHLHVGGAAATWIAVDLFLLALTSGVALAPGAVSALLRPRGRIESRFAVLAALFSASILVEAALFASNGSQRYQERYLFTLLPLVPIAYGLHARRPRTSLLPTLLVAVCLLAGLSRLPVSRYATDVGLTDSPFLAAAWKLDGWLGTTTAAFVVAAVGSVLAVVAALPERRALRGLKVSAALAVVLAVSTAATVFHDANARSARQRYIAPNPAWVDALHLKDVAAIQTVAAPPGELLEQLLWNRSVGRELLLGDAAPTDKFATEDVSVAADGTLHTPAGIVRSPILFQTYAVSAAFAGAVRKAHELTFDLWAPTSTPRLRLLATGRYWDGWLAWSGQITVWPQAGSRTSGTLALTLSLPRTAQPVTLLIGRRHVRVLPGAPRRLRIPVDGSGPQTVRFLARQGSVLAGVRPVSVRSTMPVFTPAAPHPAATQVLSLKTSPSPADR